MMAKPIKTLELHYPMIKLLIIKISQWARENFRNYGKNGFRCRPKLFPVFANIEKSTSGTAAFRFQVIICVCRWWKKLSSQSTRFKLCSQLDNDSVSLRVSATVQNLRWILLPIKGVGEEFKSLFPYYRNLDNWALTVQDIYSVSPLYYFHVISNAFLSKTGSESV